MTVATVQQRPSSLMKAVRSVGFEIVDVLRVLAAHLLMLWPTLLGAMIVGLAAVPLAKPRTGLTLGMILGVTVAFTCALAFGTRLLRDAPPRTFLYSQPVSESALWWGGIGASVLYSWLAGALVGLPLALRGGHWFASDLEGGLLWILVLVGFAALAAHAVIAMLEASSWVRFAAAPVFAAVLVGAWRLLDSMRVDSRPTEAFAVAASSFVLLFTVGLLLAGFVRARQGRLDAHVGARLFFVVLLAFALVGLLAAALVRWVALGGELEHRTLVALDQPTAQADSPWVVGLAADTDGGWRGRLREPYSRWYAIHGDSGEAIDLGSVDRVAPYRQGLSSYAAEADRLVWMRKEPPNDLQLASMDMTTREIRLFDEVGERYLADAWTVSPDGRFVAFGGVSGVELGKTDQRRVTVEVREFATGRPVARRSLTFERTGARRVSNSGQQMWADWVVIEWPRQQRVLFSIGSSMGRFAQVEADLGAGTAQVLHRVAVTPELLGASNEYRDPHFLADGSFVVATQDRVLRWLPAHQEAETLWSTPEGESLVDLAPTGHGLVVLVQRSAGGRMLRWLRADGSSKLYDLPSHSAALMHLSLDTLLLASGGRAHGVVVVDEDGLAIPTATEWMAGQGLPRTQSLTVLSLRLLRSDDGSLWRVRHDGALAPFKAPTEVALDWRWFWRGRSFWS